MGKIIDALLWGRRKSIVVLEGSQISLAGSSEKTGVKVKMLGWLESVAGDRIRGRYFKSCLLFM